MEAVFVSPGLHVAPLRAALRRAGVRAIQARSSTSAVHMADGYARAARAPGVACVTAGPGLTAALHGLAVASMDQTPVVLIAGAAAGEDPRAYHALDQQRIVGTLVRALVVAERAETAGDAAAEALALALGPPPAPVYVEIGLRAQSGESGEPPPAPAFRTPRAVRPAALEELARAVAGAERPLIVAGSGAYWAGADLASLAAAASAPVLTVGLGRGLIRDRAAQAAGPPVSPGPADLAKRADLVVVLGARRGWRMPEVGNADVWQIDLDPGELSLPPRLAGALELDAGLAARALATALRAGGPPPERRAWWEEVAIARGRLPQAPPAGSPLHPLTLARLAADAVGPEGITVVDGGDTRYWMAVAREVSEPGSYLESHVAHAVGVGVPFAIGAAVARPGTPVLAFVGDSSAAMQLSDLETAVRESLPVCVVVNNDGGMGLLRHAARTAFGHEEAPATSRTRHDLVAEALGAEGVWVTDPAELLPALEGAIVGFRPTCLDVATDPEARSPLADDLARRVSGGPDRP